MLRRSEEKKKIVRVVDRVVPLPISLSISYLSLILLLYRSPPPPGGLSFTTSCKKKKTRKKKQFLFNPSLKEMLRDTQAVANFILTVIYINVSHLYILSFQFGFSHLSKSTACSYRMHLILPIVPLSQLSN